MDRIPQQRGRMSRKVGLYAIVGEIYAAGVTSTPMIGRLLGISDTYANTILRDLRLLQPRETLEQVLVRLDDNLRQRIAEMHAQRIAR